MRGCDRVDVLVLGPWTSYRRYAPALGRDVRVVASGRPLAENDPDNFDREYDLPACREAAPPAGRRAVYFDLPPAGEEPTYTPTEPMVAGIERTCLPGVLRAALLVDPSQWLGTRLWDDGRRCTSSRRARSPERAHTWNPPYRGTSSATCW